MPIAALTVEALAGLLTILTIAGAAIVGIARLGRESRGAIVSEQSQLLHDMRGLNDELSETVVRVREERDTLQAHADTLRTELYTLARMTDRLRRALSSLLDDLEGTASELEEQARDVRRMVEDVKAQLKRLQASNIHVDLDDKE